MIRQRWIRLHIGSSRQHGAVLVMSLIILTVLALLGVTTMMATTTELRIASDAETRNRSFQAAEAGITAAATVVIGDPDTLAFQGGSIILDFSTLASNPLADMGDDTPVVTALISGDPSGNCDRSESASSTDLIGCGAFDVRSTHTSSDFEHARNASTTTLRLGISRQVIRIN